MILAFFNEKDHFSTISQDLAIEFVICWILYRRAYVLNQNILIQIWTTFDAQI